MRFARRLSLPQLVDRGRWLGDSVAIQVSTAVVWRKPNPAGTARHIGPVIHNVLGREWAVYRAITAPLTSVRDFLRRLRDLWWHAHHSGKDCPSGGSVAGAAAGASGSHQG